MQELTKDFLRCIKLWLSQRRIPGAKEGAYPVLAWVFLALQSTVEGRSVLHRLQSFFATLCPQQGTFRPFPLVMDPAKRWLRKEPCEQ